MIEMQTLNLVVFYTALLIMSIVDLKTQEISLKVLIPFGLQGQPPGNRRSDVRQLRG